MFPEPISRQTPDVIRILYEFRHGIQLKEDAMLDDMATRWLMIENRLDADITALAYELQRLKDEGKIITESVVLQSQRYKALREQIQREIEKYNREYAVGMVTDQQTAYAKMGIDAAQTAMRSAMGTIGYNFNLINLDAVASMIGFAGNGSPLYTLLQKDYGDAVHGLTNALINGIARGYGPVKTAREMANGFGMGLDRAILIARTETIRSYRTATTEQYRRSGAVTGYRRLVWKPTACMACLMRDGEFFEVEEELTDHPAGKAELPGNLIESSSPLAFETINYKGDVIIVRTASGKFLSVTPQHPVLTDRGWVAAKFIKVGDNVLSHSLSDGASRSNSPDKKHIPPVVEKIPSAFNMFRLGRVPSSSKNLYSQWEDGEVEVIFTNRLLWDSFNTTFKQQIKKKLFGSGDIGRISFNTFSNLTKMFIRKFFASTPLLSVSDSGLLFSGSSIGLKQPISFGLSSASNIIVHKDSLNNLPGNVELLSDSPFSNSRLIKRDNIGLRHNEFVPGVSGNFDAFNLRNFGFTPKEPVSLEIIRQGLLSSIPLGSGNLATIASHVVFDSVIDVGIRSFSGHVYSLQTEEMWYSSNNIISHNCTTIANIRGVKDVQWETGKQYFNKLSPEEQRARMGSEKYQLWKDGKFKLDDLSKLQHSTVWGSSPRVATISELAKLNKVNDVEMLSNIPINKDNIATTEQAMEMIQMRSYGATPKHIEKYMNDNKIEYVEAYHLSRVESIEKIKETGIKTSYQKGRDDAAYFFLDKDDANKINADNLGIRDKYAVFTIMIPKNSAAEIVEDALYNVSFEHSYSAARLFREIPPEWLYKVVIRKLN